MGEDAFSARSAEEQYCEQVCHTLRRTSEETTDERVMLFNKSNREKDVSIASEWWDVQCVQLM